jgi:DinB superfamily
MSRADLLLAQFDEVYNRLIDRLDGLTDEEYLWQPVPGCWTIHPDRGGQWVHDYAIPAPEPPPVTTIAWRLVHLADCKVMYHEWAFGAQRLTFPDLPAPPTAAGAIERLAEGQQSLRAELTARTDAALDEPVLTNWGERWPAWRIFWTMIDHDAHHGGEIGCLRDLYREGALATGRAGPVTIPSTSTSTT